MKPIFQKLTTAPDEGFVFKDWQAESYDCPWHVHPEFELILLLQGDGYRVVGDNYSPLSAGDLVFLGPNLPHIWQNDCGNPAHQGVHQLLIQFEKQLLGDALLALPAFDSIRRLLERSARGLQVVGPTHDAVAEMMLELARLRGFQRFVQFLEILGAIADSPHCQPLASLEFAKQSEVYDQERMNRVFEFMNEHLEKTLRLRDAACVAGMSEGAFSRFFRMHTGKTFPAFHNELRVGRACRLLSAEDKNITEIAYECGFSNLSNFNRQFLRLKEVSPREFRRQIWRKVSDSANGSADESAEKYRFRLETV